MKDIHYYLELKYPLSVIQEDDATYFAEYPDLKGCFSMGDTLEDVVQQAKDAKKAWLEAALEESIVIPEPTC